MKAEDKLPAWAQERLDEEARMGGSFEGPARLRVAYTLGVLLSSAKPKEVKAAHAEQLAAEERQRAAAREAIAELVKREPGLALLLSQGLLSQGLLSQVRPTRC